MNDTLWTELDLDGHGWQCARCGDPVGTVDVRWGPDHAWDGERQTPAWQHKITGELVCDECYADSEERWELSPELRKLANEAGL
jgi:hypothetical protein